MKRLLIGAGLVVASTVFIAAFAYSGSRVGTDLRLEFSDNAATLRVTGGESGAPFMVFAGHEQKSMPLTQGLQLGLVPEVVLASGKLDGSGAHEVAIDMGRITNTPVFAQAVAWSNSTESNSPTMVSWFSSIEQIEPGERIVTMCAQPRDIPFRVELLETDSIPPYYGVLVETTVPTAGYVLRHDRTALGGDVTRIECTLVRPGAGTPLAQRIEHKHVYVDLGLVPGQKIHVIVGEEYRGDKPKVELYTPVVGSVKPPALPAAAALVPPAVPDPELHVKNNLSDLIPEVEIHKTDSVPPHYYLWARVTVPSSGYELDPMEILFGDGQMECVFTLTTPADGEQVMPVIETHTAFMELGTEPKPVVWAIFNEKVRQLAKKQLFTEK